MMKLSFNNTTNKTYLEIEKLEFIEKDFPHLASIRRQLESGETHEIKIEEGHSENIKSLINHINPLISSTNQNAETHKKEIAGAIITQQTLLTRTRRGKHVERYNNFGVQRDEEEVDVSTLENANQNQNEKEIDSVAIASKAPYKLFINEKGVQAYPAHKVDTSKNETVEISDDTNANSSSSSSAHSASYEPVAEGSEDLKHKVTQSSVIETEEARTKKLNVYRQIGELEFDENDLENLLSIIPAIQFNTLLGQVSRTRNKEKNVLTSIHTPPTLTSSCEKLWGYLQSIDKDLFEDERNQLGEAIKVVVGKLTEQEIDKQIQAETKHKEATKSKLEQEQQELANKQASSHTWLGIGYVLFYPFIKAGKSLYNLTEGYKVPRSAFRFIFIFMAAAMTMAATGGLGIPGLTEWLTPSPKNAMAWHETFVFTYIATYAAAFGAKVLSQLISAAYLNFFAKEEPLSYTNPDKYTCPDNQLKEMKRLKNEKENLHENAHMSFLGWYFNPLETVKQKQLNQEIKQLRNSGNDAKIR